MQRIFLSFGIAMALLSSPMITFAADASPREESFAEAKLARTRALLSQERGSSQSLPSVSNLASESANSSSMWWRMMQGLGFCLAAMCLILWGLKRFNGRALTQMGGRRLRVVERVPVGGKNWLALVEVDGREVLLAGGADRTTLLNLQEREFDASLDPALLERQDEALPPSRIAV